MLSLLLCVFWSGCLEESEPSPERTKYTQAFEFNEKVILKAITQIIKEKGYPDPKVDEDAGKVETDYYVDKDFRTKVEASVKKIGRRENEVTLSIITEKKDSSGWKPKKMLTKEHYDKFFREIEMQVYRELAKTP